jgi:hypothetical protein
MPSFEVLLLLGVVGFYLYDSSMLLYSNEMVYLEKNYKWSFASPGNNWGILGKILYIPNPVRPDIVMLRVYWTESQHTFIGNMEENRRALETLINEVRPIQYMVLVLFVLLSLGLSIALFKYGGGAFLLIIFGMVYVTIALILAYTFWKKDVLQLTMRKWLFLVFESLLCPPFALNILRKITLNHTISCEPILLAENVFEKDVFNRLVDFVTLRIDQQLEYLANDHPRFNPLHTYRKNNCQLKK